LSLQPPEVICHLFAGVGVVVMIVLVGRWALGVGREEGLAVSCVRSLASLFRLSSRPTILLLLWLAIEVLGYPFLTPFPATRRVLGVWCVLVLLVGRLALPLSLQAIRGWVAASVGLALLYLVVDIHGGRGHQAAALEAAGRVQQLRGANEEGTLWYVGHWGFQFYAERAGLHPVIPDRPEERPSEPPLPPPSRLRAGDWLIVPDGRLNQPSLDLDRAPVDLVEPPLVVPAWLPVRTIPCYYGGRTPLEHQHGSCVQVRLYRVRGAFTPAAGSRAPFAAEPAPEGAKQPGS
jgi:hypothetical protein